jgi:hypothetical protein
MIISFDADSALENALRVLLKQVQEKAPGTSLRSLRSALWRIGVKAELSEIVAMCAQEARPIGRPSNSVPLEPVRRASGTVKEYLRSQGIGEGSKLTSGQAEHIRALQSGTDLANSQIGPVKREKGWLTRGSKKPANR